MWNPRQGNKKNHNKRTCQIWFALCDLLWGTASKMSCSTTVSDETFGVRHAYISSKPPHKLRQQLPISQQKSTEIRRGSATTTSSGITNVDPPAATTHHSKSHSKAMTTTYETNTKKKQPTRKINSEIFSVKISEFFSEAGPPPFISVPKRKGGSRPPPPA